MVETHAIAAGLPFPKVAIIETSARNAFACGLSASSAVVVATRGLLEALDDDELSAVVAHEIAHIRNGDIRLIAAANVLLGNLIALQRRNPLRIESWRQILLALICPPLLMLFLLGGVVNTLALFIARLSRLLVSSAREFVADAEAVRLTHNPAALISALRRIEGRSSVAGIDPQADAMMIDGATEGSFATHPTISERVEVLMRLSGEMAQVTSARRDTRSSAQQNAGLKQEPWGGREAAAPRPRSLLRRVSSGFDKNLFGLTRAHTYLLVGGVALLLLINLNGFRHLESIVKAANPETLTKIIDTMKEPTFRESKSGRIGSAAAADPAKLRCFRTERYTVGDRGSHAVGVPNPERVLAFSRGAGAGSSDINMERYLGMRLRSVNNVTSADETGLDTALVGYVKSRKSLLTVSHRFFGVMGLLVMQDAYNSPADREVLAALRKRLDAGSPTLLADPALAAEMRVLLAAPANFGPCQAQGAPA